MLAREPKAERCLCSVFPLQVYYRGVVCHGAKWQQWRLANPEGSMEEFFLLWQCKATAAHCETVRFWDRQGCATPREGFPASSTGSTAPPSVFETTGHYKYAERDLLKFL